jgi:ribonuclease HI
MDVYTDGSCIGNGNKNAIAGIGVFFGHNDPRNICSKLESKDKLTNQVAELIAALMAIRTIKNIPYGQLRILTDSEYLVKSMNNWATKWEINGWMTAKKTPVANIDLLKLLYNLKKEHNITFKHVKAHQNAPIKGEEKDWEGNAMADKLAKDALR